MGHTTNHCILIAQLITQGKPRGVFPFIVQVRDINTHTPLKGVTIGEIGPKLGLATVNQGFLGFNHVRIPRSHMLMKNAQVQADGSFMRSAPDVLTYGTMTLVRVGLVHGSAEFLAMAATIAVRYSAVRKQSQINANEPEVQIMDHLTQQHKLFPHLAKSVALKMAAQFIWNMYREVTGELQHGKLDRLPEMHALSCCLKAISTTDCANGIETLRLACGGHGYMASSGLFNLYGFGTAATTYEGENTVLLLQTARYLMKAWKSAAAEGKPLTPTVGYLSNALASSDAAHQFNPSLRGIAAAFQHGTAQLVRAAFESVSKKVKSGCTQEEATNATSIDLVKAAEMHCRQFMVVNALSTMEQLNRMVSPQLAQVLSDLVELFVLNFALNNLDVLLISVAVSRDQIADMQRRQVEALGRIRPNAAAIVDGFEFHDHVLNSTLGSYDGKVYERLLEDAMKSPLNQEPVNKSFELYLKPLMKMSKL